MKYLVKFFVITFFIFKCTNVCADQKIVFIDVTKIMNESRAGSSAQQFITQSVKLNIERFKRIEESLKKEETDLLSKKNILKKDEYNKKADELREKINDYQLERRSKNEKIAQQRSRAQTLLNEAMVPILADYAKENGIDLVLNKKDVVLGIKEKDITDIIIKKLDTKLPSLDLT